MGALGNSSLKGVIFSFRELILMQHINVLYVKRLQRSARPLMSELT